MTFQPGQSGNPAGRPPGSRNKKTIAAELMDDSSEAVVNHILQLAAKGDRLMLRLCLERLLPRAKQAPVAFALPKVTNAAEALGALGHIVQGVTDGELAPIDAAQLAMTMRMFSHVAAEVDHEQRIKTLETVAARIAKSK
jgi:hypothetical protein